MQLIKVISYIITISALTWIGYSTTKTYSKIMKTTVEEIPHVFDFTLVNDCPLNPENYKHIIDLNGDAFIIIGPLNQSVNCAESLTNNLLSEKINIQKLTLNPEEFGMPIISNNPTIDFILCSHKPSEETMQIIENEIKNSTADYWVNPSKHENIEQRINDFIIEKLEEEKELNINKLKQFVASQKE